MKKIIHDKKTGYPFPLGATPVEAGVNFALFSRHAEKVFLVLDDGGQNGIEEVELDAIENKTGDIWHIWIGLRDYHFCYGYRLSGKNQGGNLYDPTSVAIDPYAHGLLPRSWGETAMYGEKPVCMLVRSDFDWRGDKPLRTPLAETVIYELHPRGFTRDVSAGVKFGGSYLGLIEKIPYLKELGVTAVELLPVTEFDENDTDFFHPETGERHKNFWGYNPLSFFCLKSGYAAEPKQYIDEFRLMVRSLHQAGIEVILDMVYNHTGEGGYSGTTSSFRAIDNSIYYLLDNEFKYLNFSGCGNTLNCNHPVIRSLIRESLRYWVVEMHIDGFRFDLASILGRDQNGHVLPNPPMVEIIAEDPVLRDTKLIAEAWDAAGLYQVGTFSQDSRWGEWNGKFRDDVRRFFAGYEGMVTTLATRIAGSSDLYEASSRGPQSSINFLTSHDGFTLHDLVSFENKNNIENGEENRDGDNHNFSWNSGVEGLDVDSETRQIRLRRMKSLFVVLMFSQGVPMITAGDEFGRTQGGNNNGWCQDNEVSWIDWTLMEKNHDLLRFCKGCIHLRRSHPVFRREKYFHQYETVKSGQDGIAIEWQGSQAGEQDWSETCHHLAFLLHGKGDGLVDDNFFVMFNGHRTESVQFQVPVLAGGEETISWLKIIDTGCISPDDFVDSKLATDIPVGSTVLLPSQAVVVLQSSSKKDK